MYDGPAVGIEPENDGFGTLFLRLVQTGTQVSPGSAANLFIYIYLIYSILCVRRKETKKE